MWTNFRPCSLSLPLLMPLRPYAAAVDSEHGVEADHFIFGGFFGHRTVPAQSFSASSVRGVWPESGHWCCSSMSQNRLRHTRAVLLNSLGLLCADKLEPRRFALLPHVL